MQVNNENKPYFFNLFLAQKRTAWEETARNERRKNET